MAAPRIVHDDEWLLVVEKPPGMPSVPARTDRDPPSVIERLRAAEPGSFFEAAHRLDRDTSGLLVVARSPEARRRLARAFETGAVRKRYLAVVEGRPPADSGTLHLPIARAASGDGPRYRADPVMGVRSATRWRVLRMTDAPHGPRSLLELDPVTGRSHQLRVHLAWLGCPIVSDRLYGRPLESDAGPAHDERMLLHAASIDFPHPRDGGRMRMQSPAAFAADVHDISPGSA